MCEGDYSRNEMNSIVYRVSLTQIDEYPDRYIDSDRVIT